MVFLGTSEKSSILYFSTQRGPSVHSKPSPIISIVALLLIMVFISGSIRSMLPNVFLCAVLHDVKRIAIVIPSKFFFISVVEKIFSVANFQKGIKYNLGSDEQVYLPKSFKNCKLCYKSS